MIAVDDRSHRKQQQVDIARRLCDHGGMVVAKASMDMYGRVVIPGAIRKAMRLERAVDLVFRYAGGVLVVETIAGAAAAVQEIVRSHVPSTGTHVDDFISDRRSATLRE